MSLDDLGVKYVCGRSRHVSVCLLKVAINPASIPEDN